MEAIASSSSSSFAAVSCSEGAAAGPCLARTAEKGGLETPETGTPPPRSVSPSSDGGASLPPSERSAAVLTGPLARHQPCNADAVDSEERASCAEAEASAPEPEGSSQQSLDGKTSDSCVEVATEEADASAGTDSGTGRSVAPQKESAPRGGRAKAQAHEQSAASIAAAAASATAMAFAGLRMPMPNEAMGGFVVGGQMTSFSDRRIIEVLAAPAAAHHRLLQTAKRVPEIILSASEGPALSANVELYGSLSLDMNRQGFTCSRPASQDWASYYINGRSDVDFVVEVSGDITPQAIAERLQSKGPWTVEGQTQVHKFASTQYTLLGSFEDDKDGDTSKVYLDVTCIQSPKHYIRFKQRQEAFRRVFTDVRSHMEAQFAAQGALAFDAYIHLLKAFAAKVPGNALTGFQATCIGIFTLQIGHFRFKSNQSIALSLFEGFLRFCRYFFGETPQQSANNYWPYHYRTCGIDLSQGGRWLPRQSLCWRSELYFMAAEFKMKTRQDEQVNVLHSLDPARVSAEAQALLARAFSDRGGMAGAACYGYPAHPTVAAVAGVV